MNVNNFTKSISYIDSKFIFQLLSQWFSDGFTIRGCINELSTEDFTACQSKSSCKICTEKICNTENTGVKLFASTTIISVIIYQALLKNVE